MNDTTSVQNDCKRRYSILSESAFILKEQKKSLAKENSPAGKKLPEILSQWQQKFQLLVRQKITAELVRQKIFALAIAQNFLPAIFHRRVVYKDR